jgi:hypothetical protein
MIDIFTVLVTSCCMTAVFSRITIVGARSFRARTAHAASVAPSFRLEVIVRKGGLRAHQRSRADRDDPGKWRASTT